MNNVDFKKCADTVLEKMSSGGVFLTSKLDGKVNTMTIGWGGVNFYWKEGIFEAPVRYSRYSHDMIDKSGVFTVSVPLDNDDVKKQLAFCGSHSGRECDKIAECGLKLQDGAAVDVPVIADCSLHIECEVVFKADINKENLAADVDERWYPDYHTVFFGRIKACYML